MLKIDPCIAGGVLPRSPRTRHAALLALLACGATAGLAAQQTEAPTPRKSTFVPLFAPSEAHPFDLASLPALPFNISSSSSAETAVIAPEERDSLGPNLTQPPPRRRYSRPHYTDRLHNADGSSKLAFIAGVGFEIPADSVTRQYLTTGYKFQLGGGINLNKKLALLLQFDYDHFGLPGSVLRNQQGIYTSAGFQQQNPDGTTSPADFSTLDGNAHIWSITLNPTYNFYQGDSFGAYAVVGGGFYHKVTNFTLPQTATAFDYFYGPYQYTVNQTFDHYTSNSGGANGGIGITYKPSKFASQRLYAEVRYVHTFNTQTTSTPTNFNFFPGNSATSNYIPITVGVRF